MNKALPAEVEETLAEEPYLAQARLLKLLTHPARLAIIDILRDGEHCVCHMEAHLGYRQAYISQQLSVLRQAGLILDRRDGWNIFYRVADARVFNILNAVNTLSAQSLAPGQTPNVPCPCPHCAGQNKAGVTDLTN